MKTNDLSFDLVVAGGGLAGCAAAISAARRGLSVLLAEREAALGGAPVGNLVMPFMPWCTTVPKEGGAPGEREEFALSRGLFAELYDRLHAIGGMEPGPEHWRPFSETHLRVALDRMCAEAGVNVLFHAALADVEKDGGRIAAATFACKATRVRAAAPVFVDATGDADLAAMAGVPFRVGREADGLCQPMTLCFRISGMKEDPDWARLGADWKAVNERWRELQAAGKISNPRENLLLFRPMEAGTIHFNSTRVIKLDPTDPWERSRAEAVAREQVLEIVEFLRREFPARFGDIRITACAPAVGVRESRMIEGRHVLTADDLLALTRFPDAIAAGNYDIDIHSPDGSGTSHHYFGPGEWYTIPSRALLPRAGADNLLVAGRCISATHEAQASIRVMPIVTTLGQAAGTAAALACKAGVLPPDVDADELRAALRADGAFVG